MPAKRNQTSLKTKKSKASATRNGARKTARKSKALKGAPSKRSLPRRKARRSVSEVAKLKKAVLSGLKKGTSAADLAKTLGVSKAYIYKLKTAR